MVLVLLILLIVVGVLLVFKVNQMTKSDRVVFAPKIERELREKFRTRCQIAGVKMDEQAAVLIGAWCDEEIRCEREEFFRLAQSEESNTSVK